MNLTPHLYMDLLGRPYAEGARGPLAYDCLGLFLEVQRRLGRVLDGYESTDQQLEKALVGGEWKLVSDGGALGDGVLICGEGRWHVGCVLQRGLMIHCRAGVGVLVERYEEAPWKKRVAGIYRWNR